MKTLLIALLTLSLAVPAVCAKPQRMLMTKGTYKIPPGAQHAARVSARCLDSELDTPAITDTYRNFAGSVTVTRITEDASETKPLSEVIGEWIEVRGDNSISHLTFEPVSPDAKTSYEINITYDNGLPVAGIADADVSDLAKQITGHQSVVTELTRVTGEIRQEFGDESGIAQVTDRFVQNYIWKITDDFTVDADEAAKRVESELEVFLREYLDSVVDLNPILKSESVPSGAVELLSNGMIDTKAFTKLRERFELPVSIDIENAVDPKLVRIEEGIVGYQMTTPNKTREFPSLDDLLSALKSRETPVEQSMFLSGSAFSRQDLVKLHSAGIRVVQTPDYAFRNPQSKPTIASHVIVVSSKEPEIASGIFQDKENVNSIVKATQELANLRDPSVTVVSTRAEYETAVKNLADDEPFVLVAHHADEGAHLRFSDDRLNFSDLPASATLLSCSTYDFGFLGLRTTGTLDFENVAQTIGKLKKEFRNGGGGTGGDDFSSSFFSGLPPDGDGPPPSGKHVGLAFLIGGAGSAGIIAAISAEEEEEEGDKEIQEESKPKSNTAK